MLICFKYYHISTWHLFEAICSIQTFAGFIRGVCSSQIMHKGFDFLMCHLPPAFPPGVSGLYLAHCAPSPFLFMERNAFQMGRNAWTVQRKILFFFVLFECHGLFSFSPVLVWWAVSITLCLPLICCRSRNDRSPTCCRVLWNVQYSFSEQCFSLTTLFRR